MADDPAVQGKKALGQPVAEPPSRSRLVDEFSMPAMKATRLCPPAARKRAMRRPPRAFSPVTEETPAAAEVRLKRRTGMPAAWHSSARCEDRVVEARTMPSTR
jgi:hypothetical protein